MYKNEIFFNRKYKNYSIYDNLYTIKEETYSEMHTENIEDNLFLYILNVLYNIPNKICVFLSTCIKSDEEIFN